MPRYWYMILLGLGGCPRFLNAGRVYRREDEGAYDKFVSGCIKATLDVIMGVGPDAGVYVETLVIAVVCYLISSLCEYAEGKSLHIMLWMNMAVDRWQDVDERDRPVWWPLMAAFRAVGLQLDGITAFVKRRFTDPTLHSLSDTGRVSYVSVCLCGAGGGGGAAGVRMCVGGALSRWLTHPLLVSGPHPVC
jgi:hypothetical protein